MTSGYDNVLVEPYKTATPASQLLIWPNDKSSACLGNSQTHLCSVY